MSAPAAFSATYSDWRVLKGRKQVQIIFEVPLEAAGHAYNVLGGMPKVGGEEWFGIARLNPGTESVAHGNQGEHVAEVKP